MTETTTDIIWLTLGAFIILIGLTFLGEVLRARQDPDTPNPKYCVNCMTPQDSMCVDATKYIFICYPYISI